MRSGKVELVPITAKRVLPISDALRNDSLQNDLLPWHADVKAQMSRSVSVCVWFTSVVGPGSCLLRC